MKNILDAISKVKEFKPQHVVVNTRKYLSESTLTDEQKYKIDDYEHHSHVSIPTEEKIENVLGEKKFTHFSLQESDDVDPDVAEHLFNHGYDVHDWKAGIAAKKTQVGNPSKGIPFREKVVHEKIGSILEKTKAQDAIKQSFVNSPSRSATKKDVGKSVVISTTPYAVAGMSTGTGWNSCMNLAGGAYKEYIENDLRHGTHVAYLVHGNDETAFKHGEPSKPLARIALKPYHEANGRNIDSDTIFRPEENVYGNASSDFHDAVSQWAMKNYPAKIGSVYHKNSYTYDDSANAVYETKTKQDIEEHVHGIKTIDKTLDGHLIDHGINYIRNKQKTDNSFDVSHAIERMSFIPNLNNKHVVDLYNISKSTDDHFSTLRTLGVRHGDKFTTTMFNDYGDRRPTTKMLRSSKLPDSVVDNLETNQLEYVKRSKIKDHHIDRVVDSYIKGESGSSYTAQGLSWAMKEQHLEKLINHGQKDMWIPKSENFTKRLHDLHNMKNSYPNNVMMFSPHTSYSDFESAISKSPNGTKDYFSNMARNNNIKDDDKKKLANYYSDNAVSKILPTYVNSSFGDHVNYDKVAKMEFVPKFDEAKHSRKYIEASLKHLKEMDSGIEDVDEHMDRSEVDNFYAHMDRHETALHNHLKHFALDDSEHRIENYDEHNFVGQHIEHAENLNNPTHDAFYDLKNKHRKAEEHDENDF